MIAALFKSDSDPLHTDLNVGFKKSKSKESILNYYVKMSLFDMGIRFVPKLSQISPKWIKSGTFSDQISVHFGLSS